ncbi:MAG: glycosyltransferase [Candidatus Didemnitutus sp.]|nr:glycosyltransferase [Candidatus Didemnitutus sp.]
MPLVSVVMPVHNAAATVARAVSSVQTQTLRDWELIVVDDGSTDSTREHLLEYSLNDPRLRVVTIDRRGIVAALNAGLAVATGEFVARMDADDESAPPRLAAQARFLQTNGDCGLVGCRVGFGGDRAVSAGYALHIEWINSLLTPREIALNRFVEAPFAHPSVMFRRTLVEDHGGYVEGGFPEDYELWLRWLDAGVPMAKLPEILLTWHDLPGRLSRTDKRYSPEAFYQLKAKWIAEWLRHDVVASREIWIWGAGRPTRKRAAHLAEHGIRIAGYLDIDARKTGRDVGGVPVVLPEEMPSAERCFVLSYVGNRGARDYNRNELKAAGRVEGRDFLLCA